MPWYRRQLSELWASKRLDKNLLSLYCSCAGLEEEFVFVGRLDNLGMSYLSLQALIDSSSRPDALAEETAVRAVALFDHEEVGSASAQGRLSQDSIWYVSSMEKTCTSPPADGVLQ